MPAPTLLILSDLHLGDRKRGIPTAAMLRPLWRDVDRLILNGDTAELHDPDCVENAERETRKLVQACREDGVEVCAVAGNHDPFISSLSRLSVREGRVLITHGHTIHRLEPRPLVEGQIMESGDEHSMCCEHLLDAPALEESFARARRLIPPPEELETPRNLLGSVGYAVSRPMVLWKIMRYWRNFPRWSDRYATHLQPAAQVVLVGHSHRQGIWRVGPRVVVNTGSPTWPGRPWAVRIVEQRVHVHRILRRHAQWTLDEDPVETVDLEPMRLTPSAADAR